MKKKIISLILAIVMLCSIIPTAFAASDEATSAAEALYELGLFKGTGTNSDGTPIFDLDKTPTRNQAIIMLIRLLGKEEEALTGTWSIPFTDVTDNMKPYIGYAYTNGLTNGYTATTYCGTNPIKANQYIAFVLRSLGYESGKDFSVSTAWEMSDKIGLTDGRYNANSSFTRGDVAIISKNALDTAMKVSGKTLLETLGKTLPAGSESGEVIPPVQTPETKEIVVPATYALEATGGQNQVSLTWSVFGGRVDGYEVYQSTEEHGYYEKVATTTANVRAVTITGLAEARAYYYKVRAFVFDNGEYYFGEFSTWRGAVTASSQKFSIELPSLPVTFSWYKAGGEIYSTASLTEVRYSTQRNFDGTIRATLYFSGTKTANGSGNVYAIIGEWALIEKNTGNVAATGRIYKDGLAVGDAFRNVKANAGLVGEGLKDVSYILEVYDH